MSALKVLMLREPHWTLAVAESLSCGHLQTAIGAIPGASQFFHGGITAYSLEQKVRHLGVEQAVAESVNSVSAEVAKQMARGVARMFGTTLGLATTGYAEPASQFDVEEPFAWWAIYCDAVGQSGTRFGRVDFPGAARQDVQRLVADRAMAELIAWLGELRRS